jgi:hypothetical protein
MKSSYKIVLLSICLSASLFSAAVANAETIDSNLDQVQIAETVGNDCIEVLVQSEVQSETPSQCNPASSVVTGDEEIASQEEVITLSAMVAPQLQTLAPLAATIYTKTFSMKFHDYFRAYDVVISGRIYYDYSRVWVTQSYSGKVGSLLCTVSTAPGMNLTNTACTDTGTFSVRTLMGRFHGVVRSSGDSFDEIVYVYADSTGYVYR